MRQGNAGSKHPVLATFIVALIIAAALGAVGVFVFKTMDDTRAENAAKQRDEQVIQLADRISAKSTGDTGGGELAISSALTDLSSTDDRFWMLTNNGLVLFVKNAQETEQFRGKPASDYAESTELTKALGSVREGQTIRCEATIDNETFEANCTKLTFNGHTYQLTLLTELETTQSGYILGLPYSAALACLGILAIIVISPTLIAFIVSRSGRRPATAVRQPVMQPIPQTYAMPPMDSESFVGEDRSIREEGPLREGGLAQEERPAQEDDTEADIMPPVSADGVEAPHISQELDELETEIDIDVD